MKAKLMGIKKGRDCSSRLKLPVLEKEAGNDRAEASASCGGPPRRPRDGQRRMTEAAAG